MFGVGLLAILFICHIVTAIPADGTDKARLSQISQNGGTSGRLQTPDEFLQELFPFSDINTVWQSITGDSGTNEQAHLTAQRARGQQPYVRKQILQEPQIQIEESVEWQILAKQYLTVICDKARSVIIDSYKELGIARGFTARIYPDCIRVNRCRNSGCCADGFVCKANQTDLIEKRFLVSGVGAHQSTLGLHWESHNVVNHTSCACVPQDTCRKLSCQSTHMWNETTCACECTTMCPDPYAQDRRTCSCECPLGDNQCMKISKGLTKLPKEQCKSLGKNAMLQLPPCENNKTFYVGCCRCMKRPCEKAIANPHLKMQKSHRSSSEETPFVGDTLINHLLPSSSFSASIISKIDEASFGSKKNYNKYKIMRQAHTDGERSSSDDSSED